MRVLFHFSVAFLLFIFAGCGGGNPSKARKLPASSKLSPQGTDKVMSVVSVYYSVKNALVASDPVAAAEHARILADMAGGLVAGLQTDGAGDSVFAQNIKPFVDSVVIFSRNMVQAADSFRQGDLKEGRKACERQRLYFSPLSNQVFALLKSVEVKNAGAYKEFCPMALNDKGAYWLSEESEIKNPYFGKKMLECGEVTDTL